MFNNNIYIGMEKNAVFAILQFMLIVNTNKVL